MRFALSDMQVVSSAFEQGGAMPAKYTGQGQDVSPPLEWNDVPEGARSFAVICHDPDAPLIAPPTYGAVHWVLYNLPSSTTALAEGTTEGTSGQTDVGKPGYGGPMPPEGHGRHHYYFWVLALDEEFDLSSGLTMGELLEAVEPHVLGMNRLVGTYEHG